MNVPHSTSWKAIGVGLVAFLVALPLAYAQRSEPSRGAEPSRGSEPQRMSEPQRAPVQRAPVQQRPAVVDRFNHGTVRHVDTHVVQQPVGGRPAYHTPPHVIVGHDVDADVHRHWPWHDFTFGRRWGVLPIGCISVFVNGAPYYYGDGIYYQPSDGSYQEVYAPVGADIPQPPDGAIEIDAGGLTYYYAGGAFYVQQDNGFVVAPTPIGVTVPDLPPGAIQVSVNGNLAYQFNGVYYQPMFVDGVTQYQTFLP
jgi:hypothetical protein